MRFPPCQCLFVHIQCNYTKMHIQRDCVYFYTYCQMHAVEIVTANG